MLVKVLASGFYACQNIKTPVKVGIWSMVVNSILCALLIRPLAHAGLTLASSIASYVNCGVLLVLLVRRKIFHLQPGWGRYLLQLLVASSAMTAYLLFIKADLNIWMEWTRFVRLGWLLWHVSISAIIYIATLVIFGVRISQFRGKIKVGS